jgi:hypothetical protein
MVGTTAKRSGSGAGAARRVVGPGVGLAATWIALGLAAAAGLGAEPALRWKFTRGQTLHYQMDQKTVTQIKGTNQDIRTTVNQTIDTTWVVLSVDASTGVGTLTQTIDRVRTRIDSPFAQFEYDSRSEKAPEGPLASGVVPMLKVLVGAKFQYRMSPQGELSEIQLPEGLVKAMKEAGAGGGELSGVGMFSEEGLKNMIHESSLVLAKDPQKERTWSRQTRIPSPPIGTMILDKTYTYVGPEKEGDRITLDVKTRFEPDPKSTLDIKLVGQEGKGSFHFDSKAGHVSRSSSTEKTDMLIKVMTTEVNQITEMSSEMKLIEAK